MDIITKNKFSIFFLLTIPKQASMPKNLPVYHYLSIPAAVSVNQLCCMMKLYNHAIIRTQRAGLKALTALDRLLLLLLEISYDFVILQIYFFIFLLKL